jgi:hypothetical protein
MDDSTMGFADKAREAVKVIAEKVENLKGRKVPKYPATDDESKVLTMVEEGKRIRQYTVELFEPIWTRSILYTAGIQHLRFIKTSKSYQRQKHEDWLPQPVINIIQPKVQRVVDFFTRNRPTLYVDPTTRSEEDRKSARLGDKCLSNIWDKNQMDAKIDEVATIMITTGNAFTKTFIDTTLRNAVNMPNYIESDEQILGPDGQPIMNQMTGQPVVTKRWQEERDENGQVVSSQVPMGDVGLDVMTPMTMTVPMASKGLHEAPWVMETGMYPTTYIREMFPKYADYIPEDGSVVTADMYIHRITNIIGSGMSGAVRSMDPSVMKGYTIVHQYERAPDKDFPDGLQVIESMGIPLRIGPLPLGTRFSYNHFGYYRVPGRFWCRGMVEDLVPIQDQINKLEQFLQTNDNFNSMPTWIVPKGADIPKGVLNNRPGNVVEYTYPFEPRRISGESMSPDIVQRRQLYMEDAEQISGVRDVLQGDAPPGVTAGVALNRLGEDAEGMFSPIEKRWQYGLEQVGTSILEMVQKYYTIPRYFSITGDDGGIDEVHDFIGAQLKGNTQVKIEGGSYRPRSKAGQIQTLFDLLQSGLLPGVMMDPGQHREFLDKIGVDGFETDLSLDNKRAKWENEMLVRSMGAEEVIRSAGDNDLIHLNVHTAFMKTEQWRRLPKMSQDRHLMHQIEHLDALEEAGGRAITTGGEDADIAEAAMQPDAEGGEAPEALTGGEEEQR